MNEKQLKFLWDNYANNKGFTSYDEFKSLMASDNNRKLFFDDSNKELGFTDYNEFETILGVKKKEGTTQEQGQPGQQPTKPSAPSFGQKVVTDVLVSGEPVMKGVQKKPVEKKPYQDITYKREELPSETTQMPETPVIKAAKKDFKQSQLKPQAQLKSTPEELEEIQKKTEKVDKTGLILNDYQSTGEIVTDLESLNEGDANAVFTRIQRRPDLYAKYSGRTPEEIANFQGYQTRELYEADRDLVYKNYLADLESQKLNHDKAVKKANIVVDEIIKGKVTPESYRNFVKDKTEMTSFGEVTAGPVIDMEAVDREASEIAEKYNLPTDGEAWRLLKNNIKSQVDTEIDRPQAEINFNNDYPELEKKRRELFEGGFKADESIYARVDSQLTALESQYQEEAKREFALIDAEYKQKADKLNKEYADYTTQIKQQQDALTALYQSGQMDQLDYESAWGKLVDDEKAFYENYKREFPDVTQYVVKANEINSKYNRKFELQKQAIAGKAEAEMQAAFKKYAAEYKEDPEILRQINEAYKASFQKATEQRTAKMQTAAQLSINPISSFYQSTASALGGVFKGWGGSLNSKTLELLGESMEQTFMMPKARTEEFSDWVDPQNAILLSGQLVGSMLPSMTASAAVAIGTQGAGLPVAAQLIAGGLAGWASETVDIVGRSYLDRFERTGGNVAEANLAAERSLQSQYDIMFTYSLDALPFVGKALKFIPSKAGRVIAGGAAELVTEMAQEYPQNIADENIQAGNAPWTNLNEALKDTKRMKETLISIGPVAILGGASQLGTKSRKSELRDANIAMQQKSALNTALPDQKRQYIQNMVFSKNAKFAKGVVGTLFATGQIDEQTSKDLLVEIERSEKIKEAGKAAGLSGSKLNVYGFYSARAEEAERNAAKFGNDPILSENYKQMAKQYRDAGLDFMKGNNPDILTLTYADGSQAIMVPEDVNALFSDATALSLLNQKAISIQAYKEGGQGTKVIEELRSRAEAYAKTNRYSEAAKVESPMQALRQSIDERIRQLEAEKPNLEEKEKQEEIDRIEQELFESFSKVGESFEESERQRRSQTTQDRDSEVEMLQSQRKALGIDDVLAFFSDMKPLVPTMVERMEAGQAAPKSGVKAASDYLYAKYKELTAMKSDPNRMLTIAQIESIQAQIEQDLETLEGNPPSQKTETRDQENIQGVPGEVGEGQEPIQAEPVEVPSTEAPEAGGVLQAPKEEVTPTTEAAPKPKKPSLGQRLRTAAEAAETTVSVEEPAPVKKEGKKEGAAPAPKKEKKPTETKAKTPEIAPAPRRAGSVEASEGSNENAGVESALEGVEMDETSLNEWKKANKAPSKKGRIEELAQLVRDLVSGKIKFKDYYEKAKQLMPSKLMDKVPALTSFKEIVGSIDKNKLGIGIINLNKFVQKGMKVGLRIDIPAFNNFGKNVVTVHDRTGSGQPVIGYGSTGSIQNVTFRTSVSTAAKIGTGESKSAFAMAEGEWLDESPESIQARAEEALNSPEWIQVGMNPTRSSFFFDKADGNPVVAADEVIQVGNLVLAKNAQKIDLNTKEGMTQFENMFSAKTKEGVTYQYRRGTSLGQRLRATFDTAGERAAEDIARFLEESGIDVQIIDSVEAERIGQERNIEGSIDGIFFADKDSGVIYLNRDALKGQEGATIAYHEGIHPVINIIRNTNPELYGAIVAGIRDEAKRNPAIARVIRQIESVKEYQKRGPEAIEDEIVVETLAQIASGGIKLNELDRTLKQKMIEFFNKLVERMPRLAAAFNLKPVKIDATSQELLDFSKKLSTALTEGGRISDVVGAENVMEFAPNINLENTEDVFSNNFGQARFEMSFFEDSEDFKKLVDEGRVIHNADLSQFEDEIVVMHNPDNFFTGNMKFRGKDLIEGEGGIYFVLKYGDVWASGKKQSATQMSSLINESLERSTDGKARIVLIKGDPNKNLTSVKGAKALMGVLEILADDGLIPLSAFRKALNAAGKKYKINFDGRSDAKSIHKDIQSKFMNVSNSSFERRGDFVRDVIDEISKQDVLSKEDISKIAESIGAKRKMTTFSKASILDSVSYATSERMLQDVPNSHAYAVIEISSRVKPDLVEKHESYPWHIVSEDGSKPKLYILKNRPYFDDVFVAAKNTEKVKEGEKFGDVSRAGLAQRGMGLAKVQGARQGQLSLIDRSGRDIGPLIEEAADAVEQAIASGTAPQEALDEFIGGQEWYSELTPSQRERIDDILQEEFGTTPKVSVKKPTGIKATIASVIENYYKGDRQSKRDNKQILESDPKLKYIYDNISKINKQLQDAGVITDKTDGCP